MCVHAKSFCLCDYATPQTISPQAPLSMGLSRQEHWSGLHALLQGIFPTQGLNPCLLCLLHGRGFFTTGTTWEAHSGDSDLILPLHALFGRGV